MQNFEYYNPVRLVFGKGTISRLSELLPEGEKILLAYGGGSIKRNGVYEQVIAAIGGRPCAEFAGIEANPQYDTLMRAVDAVKKEQAGFLLGVGGGSVLDGVKFIAAAALYDGDDPWDILVEHGANVRGALPLGSVLTLPATGSEMNTNSVVSRASTREKLHFGSEHVLPRFSILDPETTFTLPANQSANGVIDAFIHVMEQYMTYPAEAPLQDRQAEAILLTLIEEGPKVLAAPRDYSARANLMWAATQALNGLICCGVPQDWSTHMIGHELTAQYGLDHAVTLAIVLPAMLRYKSKVKAAKILQYGDRVWGVRSGGLQSRVDTTIARTEEFFRSLGVKTKLSEHGITGSLAQVVDQCEKHGLPLGEHGDIHRQDVEAILELCR